MAPDSLAPQVSAVRCWMSTCQNAKVSYSNMTWGMQFALNRGTGISFWQTRSFCSWEKMVFSDSDRAVIEACFREKGWCGARIVKEFPGKKWSRQSVNRLVKKIEDTGSTSRQSGNGRPRTACTDENKDNVEDMIQSQEDLPDMHHPQRIIACELGVSQSSVSRLAHKLKLTNEFEFPEEMKKRGVNERRDAVCCWTDLQLKK